MTGFKYLEYNLLRKILLNFLPNSELLTYQLIRSIKNSKVCACQYETGTDDILGGQSNTSDVIGINIISCLD